jgi:endonuclease YncB( thermonuclease family)
MRRLRQRRMRAGEPKAGQDAKPTRDTTTTMPNKRFRYEYVHLARVVDGDTVVCDVDLGFGVWLRGEVFRLYGLNCPEMNCERGRHARAFLQEMLEGAQLELSTFKNNRTNVDKREKYGRHLAVVWATKKPGIAVNVNQALLMAGHAVAFMDTESE